MLQVARARPGRPRRGEAEVRVEHILAVSTEFFLHEGYTGTTIEGIADAAGVSKRTIYSRYPTKEALFDAVIHRLVDRQLAEEFVPAPDLPLAEALRRWAQAVFKSGLRPESRTLSSLLLREGHKFPEMTRILLDAVEYQFVIPLATYLQAQQALGRIRPVACRQVAALFINLMTNEVARRELLLEPHDSLSDMEDFVAHAVDLVVGGLLPTTARS